METIKYIKLINWVNTWLVEYKKPFVKSSTYKDICRYARYIKTSNLGQMDLKEIKSIDIQKFLNTFPKTRKKELLSTYLKAIFEKAYNLEYIERNPVKAITLDKKIKAIRYSLNLEQQKSLLKAVKGTKLEELTTLSSYWCTPK